jgi:hypothetical protein
MARKVHEDLKQLFRGHTSYFLLQAQTQDSLVARGFILYLDLQTWYYLVGCFRPALSLKPPAHACSSLPDISTLKMEAIRSSETSDQIRSTWRHIPVNGILHNTVLPSENILYTESTYTLKYMYFPGLEWELWNMYFTDILNHATDLTSTVFWKAA